MSIQIKFVLLYRVLVLMLSMLPADAASEVRNLDTAFIEDHTKDLTLRAFMGNSFTTYRLDQKEFNKALVYKSNDNLNIGVGFNYQFLGLNIAVKAPFINNDDVRFGKTKMIDFQPHIYARRFTVDMYAQFAQGYYIKDKGILSTPVPSGNVLLRPDLKTRWYGANAHYIFNHRRFSYRAAFTQNEYQKKSAGSFIIGAGIHQFSIRADSAVIPADAALNSFFRNSDFTRSDVYFIAINAGYAGTIVLKKHIFITGALMGGAGYNVTALIDEKRFLTDKKANLQLNGMLRVAAGYNSSRYFAGIQYLNFLTQLSAPVMNTWQEFGAGNFRIIVAKRFIIRRNLIKEAL